MPDDALHICLIEDDRGDYLLTRSMLSKVEGRSIQLTWVSTYEEAREAIHQCCYDVYLVDYRLGEKDGLELLREAVLEGCSKPLIVLTGQGDPEIDLAAMEAGAADYLVKDHMDSSTLERSIRYACERKRAEQDLLRAHEELEARVQQRTADLQAVNEALHAEIAERERLEETLRRQAADLAAADQAKDDFLAILGHELRNPLAAISNALQIIRLRNGAPAPTVEKAHQVLDRQVATMTRLVNDLLDVSRINRGKIELRRERAELCAVVENAVEASRSVIERFHHELAVSLPDAPVWLHADPTRLEQTIGNLLNNAAKYTEPGGRIWLDVRVDSGEVAISVRDTGIGLGEDMLPRIFEPFMQTDRSVARSQGGLGIGLTLVKQIVEMHGGTVEVHSDGVGHGSEFVVRLPLNAQESGLSSHRDEASRAPRSGGRFRILVVDDNMDAADTLSDILEAWGYTTWTSRSGHDALEAVTSGAFDVVLLDIGLPDMDGYEVARRIRAQSALSGLRIIALTGYGQEEDETRALDAGCDSYLVKPVNLPALETLLNAPDGTG